MTSGRPTQDRLAHSAGPLGPEFEGLDEVLVRPVVHIGIPAYFRDEAQQRRVQHRENDGGDDGALEQPQGCLPIPGKERLLWLALCSSIVALCCQRSTLC